jgi:hypothetical protein
MTERLKEKFSTAFLYYSSHSHTLYSAQPGMFLFKLTKFDKAFYSDETA